MSSNNPQMNASNSRLDPTMMQSNHKAPDYVRQLDKTALKNCMELALLRHEKEINKKQVVRPKEVERLRDSVERERKTIL